MGKSLVFERSAQDRKALEESGYPWVALVFAPLWAFKKGLIFHGVVLSVLYGLCALLMGATNHGIVVGAAIALWLGAFTAHNATDWLTSSIEKRAYGVTGHVDANSLEEAADRSRVEKRHRVLLENVSSRQLNEMVTGDRPETVG